MCLIDSSYVGIWFPDEALLQLAPARCARALLARCATTCNTNLPMQSTPRRGVKIGRFIGNPCEEFGHRAMSPDMLGIIANVGQFGIGEIGVLQSKRTGERIGD